MPDPVSMTFESALGNFSFAPDEMPLLGRRLAVQRRQDQGYGTNRIDCSLTGFFDRREHADIMEAYRGLLNIIQANDAQFVYLTTDSLGVTRDIIRKRVYLDQYEDPAEWKEYQGEWSLAFHYFEPPNFSIADLGIGASYHTVAGIYTFAIPPLWEAGVHSNRTSWRAPHFTPAGQEISSEITVTLTGTLTGTTNTQLQNKIDALAEAFRLDGVLNYGIWSNSVRVESVEIPSTFPRDYCEFTIRLKYDLTGVYNFKSTRSFSRLHNFPKIKPYPWCGTQRIQEFTPLGQTVRYFISIQAASITLARSLLANEAFVLITPGGIELEGGTEDWDDTEISVTLATSKYYPDPILFNLVNS